MVICCYQRHIFLVDMHLNPNAAWLLKNQAHVIDGASKSTDQSSNIQKPAASFMSKANDTPEATKPSETSKTSSKPMAPGKLVLKPEDTGRLSS